MEHWTQLSVDYANQRNYLDHLFKIYTLTPDTIRDIDKKKWLEVEKSFNNKDNGQLLKSLLKFKLFPIKDSYVAYLKRDKSAIERNPETVGRLCGRIYELGLNTLFENCSKPKETNRQIGPLFKRWLKKETLGVKMLPLKQFLSTKDNAILDGSDAELMEFAKTHLKYDRDKGLDFIARFNSKYIIGEAKFLTDFGGHQNAQFSDAISTMEANTVNTCIKIAILDGVLYINGKNKMYKFLENSKYNIMSALVLRDFLYSV